MDVKQEVKGLEKFKKTEPTLERGRIDEKIWSKILNRG